MKKLAILSVALALAAPSLTCARAEVPEQSGPWHFKSVPCVDTTVVDVAPRLERMGQTIFTAQDFEQSGVVVEYATHLGYGKQFPNARASVTHYQDTAGNDIMVAERRNDRVQVCFVQAPSPTQFCNPDKDPRGRMYRVYDYRQRASYGGMNSEHACGGA